MARESRLTEHTSRIRATASILFEPFNGRGAGSLFLIRSWIFGRPLGAKFSVDESVSSCGSRGTSCGAQLSSAWPSPETAKLSAADGVVKRINNGEQRGSTYPLNNQPKANLHKPAPPSQVMLCHGRGKPGDVSQCPSSRESKAAAKPLRSKIQGYTPMKECQG